MTERILLSHGSGGRLSHELITRVLLPKFSNPILDKLDDSAVFDLNGRIAFTTDSYVVSPIFFPGGDIGKLAVCGTVNDLSMSGAKPLFLSLSLVIEEGFLYDDLERILLSVKKAASEAGVQIVTGDTKVVNRGGADGIFINTSGVGLVPPGVNISGSNANPGDKILLSGTIGDHGIAVLSKREGLEFQHSIESDCAPLNHLVSEMLSVSANIHCMRDPTRGGLATVLNEFAAKSRVGILIYEDRIPVNETVRGACELLGFDPLYIANEGKLVAVVAASDADTILGKMKENSYGREAAVIGEVTEQYRGKVVLKTILGSHRMVDMLSGELLPRIC